MPLYSFVCAHCGHKFEELLPLSRREEAQCPQCGQPAGRLYQGRCAFGAKAGTGSSCGGNCGSCAGCGKHE
ncbi:MAG: zinc ribbon domain-containing protein [Clostridiales bacterium]|nr:zinc ribbon domain-containing protein [Clostridiales bacterium]